MKLKKPDIDADTQNPRIVWLSSFPRSGNTWVRLFLFALDFGEPDLNKMSNQRHVLQDSSRFFTNLVIPCSLDKLDITAQVMVRPAILLHMLACFPRNPLVIKSHCSNTEEHGFRWFPPWMSSGAVHLVRDPRDVAVSMSTFYRKPLKEAIEMMCEPQSCIGGPPDWTHAYSRLGRWDDHTASWLDEEVIPTHLVKYEDLLAHPSETFGDLVSFLGLDVGYPDVIRAAQKTAFSHLKRKEEAGGFVEAPAGSPFFRFGQAGGWRKQLSKGQDRFIRQEFGAVMDRLEYE